MMPDVQVSTESQKEGYAGQPPSKKDLDINDMLQKLFDLLQKSTIANREIADPKKRFWKTYRTVAEAFDNEFLAKYSGDMDMSMIFAGLFSAVCATFLTMMKPDFAQDPNIITQALLQTLVISLNASAGSVPLASTTPVWTGPSTTIIWVQSLLYASLACSLFAALAALLGKQWMSHYRSIAEQGDEATRGLERQRKFDALQAWHFRTIMEVIPVLLQLALILFGVGLCAYLWIQQRTVAIISIVANGIGAMLYISAVGVSVAYEDSPFQMPLSAIFRHWIAGSLHLLHQWPKAVLDPLLTFSRWRFRVRPSNRRAENDLPMHLQTLEAKQEPRGSRVRAQDALPRSSGNEVILTSAVKWVLVTSTDAQVQVDAWPLVSALPWSCGAIGTLPINVLDRLLYDIKLCFESRARNEHDPPWWLPKPMLRPGMEDAAASRISAFLTIFWEKVAHSSNEVQEWVGCMDPYPCTKFQYPALAVAHAHLLSLGQLFEGTVKHLLEIKRGRARLAPIGSLDSISLKNGPNHLSGICGRTLLYLAQQAVHPSIPEHPSGDIFGDILSICKTVSQSTLSEAERLICVLAPLIAIVPKVVQCTDHPQDYHGMYVWLASFTEVPSFRGTYATPLPLRTPIELTLDVAVRLLLPQLSMSYDTVLFDNTFSLMRFYEEIIPKMCVRALEGLPISSGAPELLYGVRLGRAIAMFCNHTFYSLSSTETTGTLVGPDDIVSDILLWIGNSLQDDTWYLETYMSLWIKVARRVVSPHQSQRRQWQQPTNYLAWNLLRFMTTILKLAADEADVDESDSSNNRSFWYTDDGQCLALAIAELQLDLGRWFILETDCIGPSPDSVLDYIEQQLFRIQSHDVQTVRDHLERLQERIRDLEDYAKDPSVCDYGTIPHWKSQTDVARCQELAQTVSRILGTLASNTAA